MDSRQLEADLAALRHVAGILRAFGSKLLEPGVQRRFTRLAKKIERIQRADARKLRQLLQRAHAVINDEIRPDLVFMVGGHGGIIVEGTGFCEFDSPEYAFPRLVEIMEQARTLEAPYSLEVAPACLEWAQHHLPAQLARLVQLFEEGEFEFLNPAYAQPYALIVGEESNVKQFERGFRVLDAIGIPCETYYASEAAVHPQVPQLVRGFGIRRAALRTRLLGMTPASHSGCVTWVGRDGTTVPALTDQPGVFNGEYWHGRLYHELPALLFQAVGRPFARRLIFSSIEDFVNPIELQAAVWRLNRVVEVFGTFTRPGDLVARLEPDGQFQYPRDAFFLGSYIFLPTRLFRLAKDAEYAILAAERLAALGIAWGLPARDEFFEHTWTRLLTTQAHDAYAVPFLRSGDYTAHQFGTEALSEFGITPGTESISAMCERLLAGVVESVAESGQDALEELARVVGGELTRETTERVPPRDAWVLLFNPTSHARRVPARVQLPAGLPGPLEVREMWDARADRVVPAHLDPETGVLDLLPEVPGLSVAAFRLVPATPTGETGVGNPAPAGGAGPNPPFLHEVRLASEANGIEVACHGTPAYLLGVSTKKRHVLTLERRRETPLTREGVFAGREPAGDAASDAAGEPPAFTLAVRQHAGIPRLDVELDSPRGVVTHLTCRARTPVSAYHVNYPFGVEPTTRRAIQALDFLWLEGSGPTSLLFLQKNAQQFEIAREGAEVRAVIPGRGRFEAAIETCHDATYPDLYRARAAYLMPPVSTVAWHLDPARVGKLARAQPFLEVPAPLVLCNLWRRDGHLRARVLNSSGDPVQTRLRGGFLATVPRPGGLISLRGDAIGPLPGAAGNAGQHLAVPLAVPPWGIVTLEFDLENAPGGGDA